MMPMLAATLPIVESAFLQQPIDQILFTILLWTGWIPIVVVLGYGFSQVWLSHRQGLYAAKCKYVMLAIDVPSVTEQSPKAVENLFAGIYGAKSSIIWKDKWVKGKLHPVFSLEIASTEGYIQFYLRCEERFRDLIEAAIYAHYPDAEIAEVEDYTKILPDEFPDEEYDMWGVEYILKKPSYLPIRTHADFEDRVAGELKDPLAQVLEQMAKMGPGEHMWTQILLQASGNDWKDPGYKFINKAYGIEEKKKAGMIEQLTKGALDVPSGVLEQLSGFDLSNFLFPGSPSGEDDPWKAFKISPAMKEQVDGVLNKVGKVGFGVKMRAMYVARNEVSALWKRASIVKGIYHQYLHLNMNGFGLYGPAIPKDDYFWQRMVRAKAQATLAKAFKGRSFGIGATEFYLNVEEIASLWHFPPITIKAPLIKKIEAKRAEPPVGLPFGMDAEAGLPTSPPTSTKAAAPTGLPMDEGGAPEGLPGVPAGLPMDEPMGDPMSAPAGLPMEEDQVLPTSEGVNEGGLPSQAPSLPMDTPDFDEGAPEIHLPQHPQIITNTEVVTTEEAEEALSEQPFESGMKDWDIATVHVDVPEVVVPKKTPLPPSEDKTNDHPPTNLPI